MIITGSSSIENGIVIIGGRSSSCSRCRRCRSEDATAAATATGNTAIDIDGIGGHRIYKYGTRILLGYIIIGGGARRGGGGGTSALVIVRYAEADSLYSLPASTATAPWFWMIIYPLFIWLGFGSIWMD